MPSHNPSQTSLANHDKPLTPEDLWAEHSILQPKNLDGLRLMTGSPAYAILEDATRIVTRDCATGEIRNTLFDLAWCPELDVKTVDFPEFSDDETKLLLAVDKAKYYRSGFTARHYVWDTVTRTLTALSSREHQCLASFSPDGSKVAFVSDNNLFVRDLVTGQETQLTRDGVENAVINGKPDWVYAEEFGIGRAYEWSPDGTRIGFLRFDESDVPSVTLIRYNGGYPEPVRYKYPRAGEANSAVRLMMTDVGSGATKTLMQTNGDWAYIPRLQWTPDGGGLAAQRVNRMQNVVEWVLFPSNGEAPHTLLKEQDRRYVEAAGTLHFLPDGGGFAVLSEATGWKHIHLYDMGGTPVRQVTKGRWDVQEFHGCSKDGSRLYFTSAQPTPLQRTVWSVRPDGGDLRRLSNGTGVNAAAFSGDMTRFVLTHSSAAIPPRTSIYEATGHKLRVLEDNAPLRRKLSRRYSAPREFFIFSNDRGDTLNGWLVKPADFDPARRYPVLMTVYGGPGSQTVLDSWMFGWEQYLSQEGFIVASVDGRGTGSRGAAFRKCTYGRLGRYEVEDQAAAARHLASLPYVNGDRIGVFGWSYGGFMACGCILRAPEAFHAAVAVAPVTTFRYYDTVYTEKLMGLPQTNARGYDANAPLNYAANLEGRLLLVHGLADDNVHVQNSMELVEALTKAKKSFESYFVPNRDHGISGGNTRVLLYTRMTRFLKANL